jgi:hypothetical protein
MVDGPIRNLVTGDPVDSGGGSDSIRELGVRPDSKTCIQVISQPTGDFLTTTKYCDAVVDTSKTFIF